MNRHHIVREDLDRINSADLPWDQLSGTTVLVTGANGFLPAYLVEALLYRNENHSTNPIKILALVRNRQKAAARFSSYQGRTDLEFIVQDVCDPILFPAPIDFIIHAASQASPKYYGSDPVGTLLPNSLGTHHLLALAKEKRSKGFLFFSSGDVYGRVDPSQMPMKEDVYAPLDPTDVRSCYGESKRMGETMCVCWAHQYQIPAKIVRPFHTYGPGMALDDGRVFADFVADIVNSRNIVMKSDGTAIRAFCYLSDAVTGFLTVLLKGDVGHAYNIGNALAELSIRDLANLLVELFPEKNLRVIQCEGVQAPGYLKSRVQRTCPDITKARQLGWEPTVSVQDGFRRTILSFL